MTCSPALAPAARSVATAPLGITVYGCGPDEAALFRELAPRFGVTATITDAAPSDACVELARGVRCISIGHKSPISNATLLDLRRAGVRYVSTRSIGCNHVDAEFAASIGIVVETVAYSPDSVADYTLMLVLMSIRNVRTTMQRTDAHDYRPNHVRGRELRDLTVGVVGTGRIGAAVVDRLAGFGCRVLAHDLCQTTSADYVPLDELVSRSDVVTLHTPLTDDTHHLLDARRLGQMKRGAVVVNTGRGALVDTDALLDALEAERLGGAALDVIEGEDGIFYADLRGRPVENQQLLRLQQLPQVIVTPHTAYDTDHALRDAIENSIVNCLAFEGRGRRGHA
ncbi:MAG TPA: NAD(P)-dependent oxidoreductase [Marmoricola sp.]|nr:NAD(P)-dependent oxidoreductase [Marmoricola sp.]